MDFALSEEQRMFRDMFRNFAAKEVAPRAEEIDHAETLPKEMLRKAVDQGFLGATIPEDYYGAALDNVSYVLLLENLSTACASLAVTVAAHVSQVAMSIL
ncbi:MAG: acyl-CoA dehydrogenase family protein, partial [Chloroflexi bacterium]|nr:acyl-CoA dehydrogenase family protein [Chloroflexota bacterium]